MNDFKEIRRDMSEGPSILPGRLMEEINKACDKFFASRSLRTEFNRNLVFGKRPKKDAKISVNS